VGPHWPPGWYYFDERRHEVFMIGVGMMLAAALLITSGGGTAHAKMAMQTIPVQAGAGAHGVYPTPDGAVWFSAQSAGKLGRLDPRTGKSDLIALGPGAAPHGVIVGPSGVPPGSPKAAERDRPGRSHEPRGEALPAPQGTAQCQPEHCKL
jgi:hypothetical protein